MCGHHYRYRTYDEVRTQRRPAPPADDVRVSDADRQRVITQLQTHTADGRLTLDEFEARVGEAWAAGTHGELRAVLRELPALAPPAQTRPRGRRGAGLPGPAVVALLVISGTVLLGHFAWWLIPLAFWVSGAAGLHGHRHAPRHPGRDETLISA